MNAYFWLCWAMIIFWAVYLGLKFCATNKKTHIEFEVGLNEGEKGVNMIIYDDWHGLTFNEINLWMTMDGSFELIETLVAARAEAAKVKEGDFDNEDDEDW